MKKKLFLLAVLCLTFAMSSCDQADEPAPESPIELVVKTNSSPDNIYFYYESPDAKTMDKGYFVYAHSKGGDITLECLNAEKLTISNDEGAELGHYTATVADDVVLKLHFDAIASIPEDIESYLYVVAKVNHMTETVAIKIVRRQ